MRNSLRLSVVSFVVLLLFLVLAAGSEIQTGCGRPSRPHVYITQRGMGDVSPEPGEKHHNIKENLIVSPAPGWRLNYVSIWATNLDDERVEVDQEGPNIWKLEKNVWYDITVGFDTFAGQWGEQGEEEWQFSSVPTCVASDQQSNIYVADGTWIKKYTATGDFLGAVDVEHAAVDIAVACESVYVLHSPKRGDRKLLKYDLDGNLQNVWVVDGDEVTSVAVDSKGIIYLAVDGCIYRFTDDSDFPAQPWYTDDDSTNFISPFRIRVGPEDLLYVFGTANDGQCMVGWISQDNEHNLIYVVPDRRSSGQSFFDRLLRGGRICAGAMAVDHLGYIYLTRGDYVKVIHPEHSLGLVLTWGMPPEGRWVEENGEEVWECTGDGKGDFWQIQGITVTTEGVVYVLDSVGEMECCYWIQYFDPVVPGH